MNPSPERQTMCLSAADLEGAPLALCKQAQIESFKDDYEDLQDLHLCLWEGLKQGWKMFAGVLALIMSIRPWQTTCQLGLPKVLPLTHR